MSAVTHPRKVLAKNVSNNNSGSLDNKVKHGFISKLHTSSSMETKVSTRVEWTITGVGSLTKSLRVGDFLESQRFYLEAGDRTEWTIRIYPRGKDHNDENSLSIFLILKEANGTLTTEYELQVTNTKTRFFTPIAVQKVMRCGDWNGRSNLIDTKDLCQIVRNDQIKIVCKVKVLFTHQYSHNQVQFAKKVMSLWFNSNHANIIIRTKGAVDLKVHKLILSMNSEVFANNFRHVTKDSIKCLIEIPDFDDEVVKMMLEFMYTGQIGQSIGEDAADLYAIAERYHVERLVTFCQIHLIKIADPSNALDILIIFNLHQDSKYRSIILRYICNNLAEITGNETFPKFLRDHTELYSEIMLLSELNH